MDNVLFENLPHVNHFFPINLKIQLQSFHHLETDEILGKHYIWSH